MTLNEFYILSALLAHVILWRVSLSFRYGYKNQPSLIIGIIAMVYFFAYGKFLLTVNILCGVGVWFGITSALYGLYWCFNRMPIVTHIVSYLIILYLRATGILQ